jgi:glutamate carboxypeptidase
VDLRSLLSYCDGQAPWLRETVEALVRLESPSTDKPAVDRCGMELARRLTAIGGGVAPLRQTARGDHLRVEFPGGVRQVLLLGHFDTVWNLGTIQDMPLVERDGRLHGPGIFDMKSGIGVAMLAMRALAEWRPAAIPTVVMLWTTDEEIGSETSRTAIEEEARRSAAVLVLEPSLPGGAAKTSRKGVGEFDVRVRGISAHAGLDPGKGASAIHELARQILAIEALQDLERGISLNAGVISGGTRTNVVADEARAAVDVRVQTMADAARIEEAVRALKPQRTGTSVEISGGVSRPPLERTPAVQRLYEEAKTLAAGLGRELGEGAAGGASDGNFTAALGVPTLDGLGPAGDGAHARHEHVLLADLPWRAALVAALVGRLGEVEW